MGDKVLKNWAPKKIISFLKKHGFEHIKTKKDGDHVCLLCKKTKAYTEVDLSRRSYSAREMLTLSKQTKITRKEWLEY